jgi:transposase
MSQAASWYVGIDQGTEHEAVMLSAGGEVLGQRRVPHSGEGIVELLAWVRERCAGEWAGVAVATESPHGAVVEAFLAAGAAVWAINPKQLERFRDRTSAAGAKDDRRDAWVAATALRTDRHCYRQVEESTELVVELRELGRLRERLGEQLRRASQQLRARLFEIWPELLELCPGADEPWLWALLEKAPSPSEGRRLSRQALQTLLRQHRIRRLPAATLHQQLQRQPVPASAARVAATRYESELLVAQLRLLRQQCKDCERRLTQRLKAAVAAEKKSAGAEGGAPAGDVEILLSWPGLGVLVATTLIGEAAHLLRDYQRLRLVAGVAPVTKRSGKSSIILRRLSYNRRLQNAVHYWIGNALKKDAHLRARYRQLRAHGHGYAHALRQLGDASLRALAAALQAHTLYQPQNSLEEKPAA